MFDTATVGHCTPSRSSSDIAINVVGFLVRYYIVFPKLLKDSTQRMNDTWYLARLKACKAA